MKQLSTSKPPKYLFLFISIGAVSLVLLFSVRGVLEGDSFPWVGVVIATVVSVGVPLMLHLANNRALKGVADEVWDCGDSLMVRQEGSETIYPLAKCVDVVSFIQKPPGRFVSIIYQGDDGKPVTFTFLIGLCGEDLFSPLKTLKDPALVTELRQRITAARQGVQHRMPVARLRPHLRSCFNARPVGEPIQA